MSNEKKYRLLKDLPGVPKETLFGMRESAIYEAEIDVDGCFSISEKTILQFPEWFEEVVEPISKTVNTFYCDKDMNGNFFCITKEQALKIVSELNQPEKQTPEDIRGWVVECFTSKDRYNYHRKKSGGYTNQPFDKGIDEFHFLDHPEVYKITSVKRLSDGTIWVTKQKVTSQRYGVIHCEITGFKIIGNTMIALIAGANVEIESLELPHKTEQKEVLSTTEDGQPVYDRQPYWTVNEFDWLVCKRTPSVERGTFLEKWLTSARYHHHAFSTEEKAKDYVLMNKPCLSVNDVLSLDIDAIVRTTTNSKVHLPPNVDLVIFTPESLKKIAKSKTL